MGGERLPAAAEIAAYNAMNSRYRYEIRVEGRLPDRWSSWFEGLVIEYGADETTALRGELPDQAALFGVLAKIHNLNLMLISVQRLSVSADTELSASS